MNAEDIYTRRFPGSIGVGMFAVTPSDTVNSGQNQNQPFAMYVAASGNVSFIGLDGITVSAMPVVAGSTIPCAVTQVLNTGTTATIYGIKP